MMVTYWPFPCSVPRQCLEGLSPIHQRKVEHHNFKHYLMHGDSIVHQGIHTMKGPLARFLTFQTITHEVTRQSYNVYGLNLKKEAFKVG